MSRQPGSGTAPSPQFARSCVERAHRPRVGSMAGFPGKEAGPPGGWRKCQEDESPENERHENFYAEIDDFAPSVLTPTDPAMDPTRGLCALSTHDLAKFHSLPPARKAAGKRAHLRCYSKLLSLKSWEQLASFLSLPPGPTFTDFRLFGRTCEENWHSHTTGRCPLASVPCE